MYYNIHHILADEWTCDMLVHAVFQEYGRLPWQDTMRPSWGSARMTSPARDQKEREGYVANWKAKLEEVVSFDTSNWPKCESNLEARSLGSTSVVRAPLEISGAFQSHLNANGLSLFDALLSIFQLVVHK